ncbi:hypothetical protein [Candidatus Phytoplasma solani]|uniref:hypothetical protein n=1 Tax=Candidatus Phytoplasma solani TaxID=69896 RepID=UPI0035900A9E
MFEKKPYFNGVEMMTKWLKDKLDTPIEEVQNQSYNSRDGVGLKWPIKNPPKELLGVYFQGGERDALPEAHTLNQLKKMGNGASNMYIFLLKKKKRFAKIKPIQPLKAKKAKKAKKTKKVKKTKKLFGLLGW